MMISEKKEERPISSVIQTINTAIGRSKHVFFHGIGTVY